MFTSTFVVTLLLLAHTVFSAPVSDLNNLKKRALQCPDYCRGTFNTNDTTLVCGDWRLGPVDLPTTLPLSNTVYGYDRFGGMCPGAFLATWWNDSSKSYIYPPSGGFQLTTASLPLQGQTIIQPGALIDRFGSEYGTYFAPYGSPYEQRALPPSNLVTPPDKQFPYNYHIYAVLRNLTVQTGPIAGWFDQPGQGTQYMTDRNVLALIGEGWLRRVTEEEVLGPRIDT